MTGDMSMVRTSQLKLLFVPLLADEPSLSKHYTYSTHILELLEKTNKMPVFFDIKSYFHS
jgi:hypothetical protein